MKEPYGSTAFEGATYIKLQSAQYQKWREMALNLPKFGSGNAVVDDIAHKIVDQLFVAQEFVFNNPVLKQRLDAIDNTYELKIKRIRKKGKKKEKEKEKDKEKDKERRNTSL
jgi:hypothetical protein